MARRSLRDRHRAPRRPARPTGERSRAREARGECRPANPPAPGAAHVPVTRPSWLDAKGAWLQRCCGLTAFLIFLLAGCAASGPRLSPADYPFHSVALPTAKYPSTYPVPSVAPQIELHWRLTVESNRVQADGLIERQQESQIQETWLQLVGIDATAGIVSFTPPTRFAWRSPSALESFTMVLRPNGGEQQYEVRLYMFEFAPQLTSSH